ncbi:hypothetical protein [Psychromonas ingrahamii]|uniref:hypothetical protein n=1 Tax=Psychromonas ingrahamii TaxID=357794 RepID=UPI0003148671|nr:hypothetical protein [Psychromonas ingrahamii]
MKFFTFIFTLLISAQGFAHQDHALGEGSLHLFYHAIFWGLCAVVTVKAVGYFKNKKNQKTEK